MGDFFVSDSSGSGNAGSGASTDFFVSSSAPVSNCTASRFDSALSDSFFVASSPEASMSMGE